MYQYWSFYFGHGGWPDEAIWRVNQETGEKQTLIVYPAGRGSVEELLPLWDQATRDLEGFEDSYIRIEPHYTTWGSGDGHMLWFGLRYWQGWKDGDAAQAAWDRDAEDSWGGPTPYQYLGGVSLWQ